MTDESELVARYEIKMVVDDFYENQLRSWIHLHSWAFRTAYPSRRVNNIYFDTHDMDTYTDHIDGVTLRRKLRFRWYGENLKGGAGQIEVKNKKERVGWKLIQRIAEPVNLDTNTWRTVNDQLRSQATGVIRSLLEASHPVLVNTYLREYFISADQRVRLTIDRRLRTYNQTHNDRPNLSFIVPEAPHLVIEFKCDVNEYSHLADGLAEFPMRCENHSKYASVLYDSQIF